MAMHQIVTRKLSILRLKTKNKGQTLAQYYLCVLCLQWISPNSGNLDTLKHSPFTRVRPQYGGNAGIGSYGNLHTSTVTPQKRPGFEGISNHLPSKVAAIPPIRVVSSSGRHPLLGNSITDLPSQSTDEQEKMQTVELPNARWVKASDLLLSRLDTMNTKSFFQMVKNYISIKHIAAHNNS